MTERDIHFEVFCRPDSKGAWALHDVSSVREKALAMAADLMRAAKTIGVKVVKESYDAETGDYLSRTIFEDGHTNLKLDQAQEDAVPVLPCFKPEDLYSQHARATLTRLLRDYLARQKITATELIHRADCLDKLEASGTTLQHAVQKVAVAQASSSETPVQQLIKALNDLMGKAVARVDSPDANSIPWLLVTVIGHSGDGILSRVTSIQRIQTHGGQAPADGCNAAKAGAETKSSYTAEYVFYAPGK